jgi:hypothetical protein
MLILHLHARLMKYIRVHTNHAVLFQADVNLSDWRFNRASDGVTTVNDELDVIWKEAGDHCLTVQY